MDDLAVAVAAARAGAAIVRRWFRRTGDPDMKGTVDPVTRADREAEAAVAEVLRLHRPDDGLLAEEGTTARDLSGRRWVVDPLDGTVNFVHGIPQCAVSVALEDDRGSLAGAVIDVFRDEEYTAARGKGARLNGEPIRVSSVSRMIEAVFSTGFPYDRHCQARAYTDTVAAVVTESQGVRRTGAAAIDLAWVACGRYDGHWEFGLKPWDVAAGTLLISEAGGRSTDSYGEPARAEDIVTTNGSLHEPLRRIIAAHRPDHFSIPRR
jgi:myo-inositol-1(or 4)-monophosphatase